MRSPRTWLRVVLWSGAFMLLVSGLLLFMFPRHMGPLPEGLRTPVLALELARSEAELERMFGPPGSTERAEWVERVDHAHYVDFLFLLFYSTLLFASARTFITDHPARARLAMTLAPIAGASDAVENSSLLAITARLGGEYSGLVTTLILATWLKWIAIALTLALIAPSLHARGGFGRAAAWVTAAVLPVTLLAAAVRGVVAESMLLVMTLGFLCVWIEALRARRVP